MTLQTPIIADKELFRLWYEFYRLAVASPDVAIKKALKKSQKFYADWNVSENLHFDEWWRSHRFLFYDEKIVRLSHADEERTDENFYIAVPRAKSYADIVEELKHLLAKEQSAKKKGRKSVPVHRFAPTEIQGVKRDSLRMLLDLQKHVFVDRQLKGVELRQRVLKFFASERYKKRRNIIPMTFAVDASNRYSDHVDEADRSIRRYRQKAHQLLLNVASGKFPGKY